MSKMLSDLFIYTKISQHHDHNETTHAQHNQPKSKLDVTINADCQATTAHWCRLEPAEHLLAV